MKKTSDNVLKEDEDNTEEAKNDTKEAENNTEKAKNDTNEGKNIIDESNNDTEEFGDEDFDVIDRISDLLKIERGRWYEQRDIIKNC